MRSSAEAFALALLLTGCAAGPASHAATLGSYGNYQDAGLASWYGDELAGARTASGARFDPGAITAAHRTLPLGSFAEVTSVETGRSIIVLINDRGPGRRDRIIDLSRGAAHLLGTDRHPLASVRIRAIVPSREDAATLRAGRAVAVRMPADGFVRAASVDALPLKQPLPRVDGDHRYALRIATFSNRDRADALARALDAEVIATGSLWRVILGPYDTAKSLQRARDAVAARGYGDAQILPAD